MAPLCDAADRETPQARDNPASSCNTPQVETLHSPVPPPRAQHGAAAGWRGSEHRGRSPQAEHKQQELPAGNIARNSDVAWIEPARCPPMCPALPKARESREEAPAEPAIAAAARPAKRRMRIRAERHFAAGQTACALERRPAVQATAARGNVRKRAANRRRRRGSRVEQAAM